MKFLIGKNSGFCFGVKRAIDEAFKLQNDKKFVLGEIIHNESVVKKLHDSGVVTISSLDDERLESGATLIIRTHGEGKDVFEKAKEKGLKILDCTCPFVRDIQEKVYAHYKQGYQIIIIGNASHPEIIGINGWCDNTAIITETGDEFSIEYDERVSEDGGVTHTKLVFGKNNPNMVSMVR